MRGLALALVLLVGCAAAPRDQEAPRPSPAADWFVEMARVHAAVDATEDTDERRRLLEAARARPAPQGASFADVRRVRQDLAFRLATLELAAGRGAEAEVAARAGLALGAGDDEFTANLWIVAGRAEALQGRPREAARSYTAALAIHERLLDRALQGAP